MAAAIGKTGAFIGTYVFPLVIHISRSFANQLDRESVWRGRYHSRESRSMLHRMWTCRCSRFDRADLSPEVGARLFRSGGPKVSHDSRYSRVQNGTDGDACSQ